MEDRAETIGRKKVATAVFAFISILGGAIIYILFRPTHLLMFFWIDRIGLMDFVNSIRPVSWNVPEWVVYSLPDGLWLFSYCLFIGCVWDFNLRKCLFVLTILPVYAVSNEIMQFFHLVSGTFDWMDLFAFLMAFALGTLYINVIKKKRD